MSSKVALLASLAASMVAPSLGQDDFITISTGGVGANSQRYPGFFGPLTEPLQAWAAWPDAKFQYFGAEYYTYDFDTFVPGQPFVPGGARVQFTCPDTVPYCDVVVYLYQCYPCESQQGGLPRQLIADGYARTRCGPSFTTGSYSGYNHKMTAFIKRVPGNVQEIIELQDTVEYVFFAIKRGDSVDCTGLGSDPYSCMAPENKGLCKTALGQCGYSSCTQGPSPNNGCDLNTCVKKDLPF